MVSSLAPSLLKKSYDVFGSIDIFITMTLVTGTHQLYYSIAFTVPERGRDRVNTRFFN